MLHTAEIPHILRDAGLATITIPGWDTRGGNTYAYEGHVIHDTVGWGHTHGDAPTLDYITYTSKIAPLSNCVVGYSGTIYLVAARRANHAGRGSRKVLAEIRAGQEPQEHRSLWDRLHWVSGNGTFWGWEVECNPTLGETWTPAQRDAVRIGAAAINRAAGWPAARTIGHKEWAPWRKPDPASVNCPTFRARIAETMHDRPAPAPPTSEDDEMEIWIDTAHNKAWLVNLGLGRAQVIKDPDKLAKETGFTVRHSQSFVYLIGPGTAVPTELGG